MYFRARRIILLIFFVAMGMVGTFGIADTVHAASSYTYFSKFGSSGSGSGQFSGPREIAISTSSQVYVADNVNNRIEVFDSAGNYLSQFGSLGSGAGQMNSPTGIAFSSSSDMYVVDYNNNRIDVFDSAGNFISTFGWGVSNGSSTFEICTSNCQAGIAGSGNGQLSRPANIALSSSSQLFVSDHFNNRIEVFDSAGNYLSQFGTLGTSTGELQSPTGIALSSSSDVYVADESNHRIEVFDSAGNFISTFGWGVKDGASSFEVCTSQCQQGISGSGNGQFALPFGVAISSSSGVYVSDYSNNRIEVFDSAGNYLSTFGSSGSGDGQFSGSVALAFSSSSLAYVVDFSNQRVQIFSPIITVDSASITSPSTLLVNLTDTSSTLSAISAADWHVDQNGGGVSPLTASSATIINSSSPWKVELTFSGSPWSNTSASTTAALGLYADENAVTDANGVTNVLVPHDQSIALSDGQAPLLSGVSIGSNNTIPSHAVAGDSVTLTFTASESISTPTVTLLGHSVASTNTTGNTWTTSYTLVSSDATGQIPFTIDFQDSVGNRGTEVSATTDQSKVTFVHFVGGGSSFSGVENTNESVSSSSASSTTLPISKTIVESPVSLPESTEEPVVKTATPEVVLPNESVSSSTRNLIFTTFLSQGAKSDSVVVLQTLLAHLHVYTGPITGYYGPLTAAGVRAFQAEHGIAPVGIVGPLTRGVLNTFISHDDISSLLSQTKMLSLSQNISMGSRGDEVTNLQIYLTRGGYYTGPITGYYGPLTAAGVRTFQTEHGIAPIGMVGPLTRKALENL
ncbi:MAG: peptidoglycan-binding protein [Patescibacteria group bacterium]|nr:peptidoglycan-binding protein [Patescibacteria group bacterium]MDE2438270.1 peptidoglycan-binding protein [Patescibacteria group bacterium]